jgi:hypothetical protein
MWSSRKTTRILLRRIKTQHDFLVQWQAKVEDRNRTIERLNNIIEKQDTRIEKLSELNNSLRRSNAKLIGDRRNHVPVRGSKVEAYIKRHRDQFDRSGPLLTRARWQALDDMIDDYRLRSDCGVPLLAPMPETPETGEQS